MSDQFERHINDLTITQASRRTNRKMRSIESACAPSALLFSLVALALVAIAALILSAK